MHVEWKRHFFADILKLKYSIVQLDKITMISFRMQGSIILVFLWGIMLRLYLVYRKNLKRFLRKPKILWINWRRSWTVSLDVYIVVQFVTGLFPESTWTKTLYFKTKITNFHKWSIQTIFHAWNRFHLLLNVSSQKCFRFCSTSMLTLNLWDNFFFFAISYTIQRIRKGKRNIRFLKL